MTAEEWIEREYERIVAEYGSDGVTSKEARDISAQRYEAAVRSGEINVDQTDLYVEGGRLFDRIVKPLRQRRKSSLISNMETIRAAINDETILGQEDPILHLAYPLGTQDGRDKILSLWTVEDWRNGAITRYDNAAEVTAAAQAFSNLSSEITSAMIQRSAHTTGGLFGGAE